MGVRVHNRVVNTSRHLQADFNMGECAGKNTLAINLDMKSSLDASTYAPNKNIAGSIQGRSGGEANHKKNKWWTATIALALNQL